MFKKGETIMIKIHQEQGKSSISHNPINGNLENGWSHISEETCEYHKIESWMNQCH
jgi:hypothetical protein